MLCNIEKVPKILFTGWFHDYACFFFKVAWNWGKLSNVFWKDYQGKPAESDGHQQIPPPRGGHHRIEEGTVEGNTEC